jgi:hypothetical protein
MKRILLSAALALGIAGAWNTAAKAELPMSYCYRQSQVLPWHNAYYAPQWGTPVALVVPPTAEFQTNYGWGVGGTRVSPIYHQFGRPFPGWYGPSPGYGWGYGFQPTPRWQSDTQQGGYDYIRAPW